MCPWKMPKYITIYLLFHTLFNFGKETKIYSAELEATENWEMNHLHGNVLPLEVCYFSPNKFYFYSVPDSRNLNNFTQNFSVKKSIRGGMMLCFAELEVGSLSWCVVNYNYPCVKMSWSRSTKHLSVQR